MDISNNNNFDSSLMIRVPTSEYPVIPLPRKYNPKITISTVLYVSVCSG